MVHEGVTVVVSGELLGGKVPLWNQCCPGLGKKVEMGSCIKIYYIKVENKTLKTVHLQKLEGFVDFYQEMHSKLSIS